MIQRCFLFLRLIADKHVQYSLPSIMDGSYEGEHWLGSFALYALQEAGYVFIF